MKTSLPQDYTYPDLVEIFRTKYQPIEGSVAHEVQDYVHEFGDPTSALLYGTLFVPEFTEVDGSVLLAAHGREREFRDAKAQRNMPLSELEASFNYVEVPYLFLNGACSDAEELLLAKMIAKAWRAQLLMLYPNRMFDILVRLPEETGHVAEVRFSEVRE
jgi:hypothetical protein